VFGKTDNRTLITEYFGCGFAALAYLKAVQFLIARPFFVVGAKLPEGAGMI